MSAVDSILIFNFSYFILIKYMLVSQYKTYSWIMTIFRSTYLSKLSWMDMLIFLAALYSPGKQCKWWSVMELQGELISTLHYTNYFAEEWLASGIYLSHSYND